MKEINPHWFQSIVCH